MGKQDNKARVLIIGCGYLGKALLTELRNSDKNVYITTRSGKKPEDARNTDLTELTLDINDSGTWDPLEEISRHEIDLYFLVPAGRINLNFLIKFIAWTREWQIRCAVLSSSTMIYGDCQREVDADSEVDISNPRAKMQYNIEQAWMQYGARARIVRLAGLYGPGRVIGKQRILRGELIPGKPDSWLNLIHIDDAAALLHQVADNERAGKIELGCDGVPLRREAYYTALARHLNVQMPIFSDAINSKEGGRRCSNLVTIQRTGWLPVNIDYKAAWS